MDKNLCLNHTALHVQSNTDLLYDEETHDIILSVNGLEFKAHQLILRHHSSFFRRELGHRMLKMDLNACPIAFEMVLSYIYTGIMDFKSSGVDTVCDVVRQSLLFELTELCKAAIEFLLTMIDLKSCWQVKKLATEIANKRLLDYSMDFIDMNVIDFLKSDNILTISETELKELFKRPAFTNLPDSICPEEILSKSRKRAELVEKVVRKIENESMVDYVTETIAHNLSESFPNEDEEQRHALQGEDSILITTAKAIHGEMLEYVDVMRGNKYAAAIDDFLAVDLGSMKMFNNINFFQKPSEPCDYTISLSDDNVNWRPKTTHYKSFGQQNYFFDVVEKARYIKFSGPVKINGLQILKVPRCPNLRNGYINYHTNMLSSDTATVSKECYSQLLVSPDKIQCETRVVTTVAKDDEVVVRFKQPYYLDTITIHLPGEDEGHTQSIKIVPDSIKYTGSTDALKRKNVTGMQVFHFPGIHLGFKVTSFKNEPLQICHFEAQGGMS